MAKRLATPLPEDEVQKKAVKRTKTAKVDDAEAEAEFDAMDPEHLKAELTAAADFAFRLWADEKAAASNAAAKKQAGKAGTAAAAKSHKRKAPAAETVVPATSARTTETFYGTVLAADDHSAVDDPGQPRPGTMAAELLLMVAEILLMVRSSSRSHQSEAREAAMKAEDKHNERQFRTHVIRALHDLKGKVSDMQEAVEPTKRRGLG